MHTLTSYTRRCSQARHNRGVTGAGHVGHGCIPERPVEIESPECGARVEWASRWASGDPQALAEEATERPI
jgi:hypothetical protein